MDNSKSILKERCIQLLSIIEQKRISYPELIDILELVTLDLEVKKEVIREAQEKGILRKEGKNIILYNFEEQKFKPNIIRRELEDRCRRCGRTITKCYYIEFLDSELGPYGSSCIKKSGLTRKI